MADPEHCLHEWEFHKDWGGNPDIPNGTFDCSYYYCPLCDTTQDDKPEDFPEPDDGPEYEPEEPDVDYIYDPLRRYN